MRVRLWIHTNKDIVRLVFPIFQPSEVCPKNRPFLKIFLWSPLCWFAKNWHFRHCWKNCFFCSNMSFSFGFLLSTNLWELGFECILIRILYGLYFLFFSLPKFAQKIGHFWRFFYGPPFAGLPKTAIFDTVGKIDFSLPMSFSWSFFSPIYESRYVFVAVAVVAVACIISVVVFFFWYSCSWRITEHLMTGPSAR